MCAAAAVIKATADNAAVKTLTVFPPCGSQCRRRAREVRDFRGHFTVEWNSPIISTGPEVEDLDGSIARNRIAGAGGGCGQLREGRPLTGADTFGGKPCHRAAGEGAACSALLPNHPAATTDRRRRRSL